MSLTILNTIQCTNDGVLIYFILPILYIMFLFKNEKELNKIAIITVYTYILIKKQP